jgi:hypothetical protein
MRSTVGGIVGLMALVGCSSSSDSTNAACAHVNGSYELTVSPTGQSENQAGQCSPSAPPQMVEIDFADGAVSLDGQDCVLCSTSGCQMNVVCGQGDTGCSGGTTPVTSAPDSYVQNASFALPMQPDASTRNALVELGPGFCAFEGTATQKN